MRILIFASFTAVMSGIPTAHADDGREIGLSNHEPNLIGYTYDSDDKEYFMDFKISLQYPLAHGPINKLTNKSWYPDFLKRACTNSTF